MHCLLNESPLEAGILYRLLSGTICPRPIAWVATQDRQGNANLAPFSFFNVVSVDPQYWGSRRFRTAKGAVKTPCVTWKKTLSAWCTSVVKR